MTKDANSIATTSRAVIGESAINCKTPRQTKYAIASHCKTAETTKRIRLYIFIASTSLVANFVLMVINIITNWKTSAISAAIIILAIIGMSANYLWLKWPNEKS